VSILVSIPFIGEPLDMMTLGFALAVVATVFLGKNLTTSPAPAKAKSSQAEFRQTL